MSSPRLALLICDDVMPAIKQRYGDYGSIFNHLLSSSLAQISSDVTFTLDAYDVVKDMAYPPDDVHYDGLLITGSRASACEDVEWINKLIAYVKRIIAEKPFLKVFGICFGHQIVARALGGSCVPNDGRWEVAVTTVQLTSLGKAIFGSDQLDIQQMHRDHVPTTPTNAHLLGSTDVTLNQGMVVFDDTPAPLPTDLVTVPLTSIHALTVQGHPEFTPPIMNILLEARIGMLGEKLVKEARLRAGGVPGRQDHHPDGLACDGVGRVGRAIWGVLGIA